MDKNNHLYLDFGNTRLKALYSDKIYYLDYNDNLSQFLISNLNLNIYDLRVYYSSVNSFQSKKFIELNNIYKFVPAIELLANQKLLNYSEIYGIGSDRLLGLYYLVANNYPDGMTIDFGTAITINILKNCKVIGGFILPGIDTAFKSLNYFTDSLPITKSNFIFKIPDNTIDAISIGTSNLFLLGLIGLLKKIILGEFYNRKINIFVAGGNSTEIYSFLLDGISKDKENIFENCTFEHQENLVIFGLKLLENNKENE